MVKQKILLIADIGVGPNGFFHIGDEAMFWKTYQWYASREKKYEIGTLTREKFHFYTRAKQQPHLLYPIQPVRSRLYFLLLYIRSLMFLKLGWETISSKEKNFIDFVLSYDVLHFTGGGNFYSLSPPWLYYAFFLLLISRLGGKTSYLISQTIGPFNWFDRIFVKIFLNIPQLIALREPKGFSPEILKKYGITQPREMRMLDVAYENAGITQNKNKNKTYTIGLSIHSFQKFDRVALEVVRKLIKTFSQEFSVEFRILPHIIEKKQVEWDAWFMEPIVKNFSSLVTFSQPSYQDIMESDDHPAVVIQKETAALDILVASRYHGLVFGLANDVPCIALQGGEYYKQKNLGLLSFIYEDDSEKYTVDLTSRQAAEDLIQKSLCLIENLQGEKEFLIKKNSELKTSNELFHLDTFFLP